MHTKLDSAQTCRDDLHALVYIPLLFAHGSLPLGHIRGGTVKHCAQWILEKKHSWPAARLCRDLPHEFEAFSSYYFDLEIDEGPDYQILRDNLTTVANREG